MQAILKYNCVNKWKCNFAVGLRIMTTANRRYCTVEWGMAVKFKRRICTAASTVSFVRVSSEECIVSPGIPLIPRHQAWWSLIIIDWFPSEHTCTSSPAQLPYCEGWIESHYFKFHPKQANQGMRILEIVRENSEKTELSPWRCNPNNSLPKMIEKLNGDIISAGVFGNKLWIWEPMGALSSRQGLFPSLLFVGYYVTIWFLVLRKHGWHRISLDIIGPASIDYGCFLMLLVMDTRKRRPTSTTSTTTQQQQDCR